MNCEEDHRIWSKALEQLMDKYNFGEIVFSKSKNWANSIHCWRQEEATKWTSKYCQFIIRFFKNWLSFSISDIFLLTPNSCTFLLYIQLKQGGGYVYTGAVRHRPLTALVRLLNHLVEDWACLLYEPAVSLSFPRVTGATNCFIILL